MLNGLGQATGITNIASFYPTGATNIASFYPTGVRGQITNIASFYPTAPYEPMNTSGAAPGGGGVSTALIQAATAAGLTPTQFTQQAVNAGYSPTQWAAMAAAQRQAALARGALPSGAPSPLTSANMTPILLIGGAVLLFVMMRK